MENKKFVTKVIKLDDGGLGFVLPDWWVEEHNLKEGDKGKLEMISEDKFEVRFEDKDLK